MLFCSPVVNLVTVAFAESGFCGYYDPTTWDRKTVTDRKAWRSVSVFD